MATSKSTGSRRTAVAQETIRDWLKKYRRGGFDALLPKSRTDRGKPRKLPREVSDLLLAAKEEDPDLTVPLVIKYGSLLICQLKSIG
jgi:putative transposase